VTWLVPSVRRGPPEITEKRLGRRLVQPRAPPRTAGVHKKTESVPRPEPVQNVPFDEPVSRVPTPVPVSAPSSPRGRSIPLPRCKNHTPQSEAVPLPPAPAPITADESPLSSAETLTEAPAEVKRAFSLRLTRVLRGRQQSRSSTIASTTASSSSATVASELSEPGKAETRMSDVKPPNATERGRFAFLKKSKTIDVQIGGRMFSFYLV